jgi:hypothetical protein
VVRQVQVERQEQPERQELQVHRVQVELQGLMEHQEQAVQMELRVQVVLQVYLVIDGDGILQQHLLQEDSILPLEVLEQTIHYIFQKQVI